MTAAPHSRPQPKSQSQSQSHSDERLDSWKEIASFLKRGVRTVQRWEQNEGLPVHRHRHASLGSVYAFKAEVSAWWESRGSALDESAAKAAPQDAASRRKRLLVLPFENLSGNPAQDYLADGFTEETIAQLSLLDPERLAVIARTTAMHYKARRKTVSAIARELGVDYVLEGSVRRNGDSNEMRLIAQLIQTSDQTHIWTQTYNRDLGSAFALQEELAAAIAREIRLALAPAPSPAGARGLRTENPRAYEAHLQGRYHLNRMIPEGFLQAAACFEQAVGADPSYAVAYAGLSQAYAIVAMVPFDAMPPHEVMPKARMAAQKALELNDRLPEAHVALGTVLHHYEWDWRGAERAYLHGLELNPDYTSARLRYAWLLLSQSRGAEALAQIQQAQSSAQETDPHLLVVIRATRAAAFYYAREYDRCIAECREALQLDSSYFLLHYLLARAQARVRKGAAGKTAPAFKSARVHSQIPLMQMAAGLFQALAGRKAEARAALRALLKTAQQRYIPATYIAILHAALGDTEGTFKWLEKAYEERADGLTLMNVEASMDHIRDDPRFRQLVRRIGLGA